MADYQRASAAVVDGVFTLRTSALGGCPAGLRAESEGRVPKLNAPPPRMQKAMDDSSDLEEHAIDIIRDETPNLKIVSNHETVLRGMPSIGAALTSTPDAYAVGVAGNHRAIEVKCMAPSTYEEWDEDDYSTVWEKYRWQVAGETYVTRLPTDLWVFEKKDGGLTGAFKCWPAQVQYDFSEIDVFTRVENIMNAPDECPGQGEWCPYESFHSRPKVHVAQLLTQRDELRDRIADLSSRLSDINDQLAKEVKAVGGKAICETSTGDYLLSWVDTHVVEKKPREYDRRYLAVNKRET